MLIAICDDEQRELEAIEKAFRITATEISGDLEIAAFPSGTALIGAVKNGIRPVLAVLDVYMGEENGIETASALRCLLPNLPCAFLTTSRDFAVEAFALDALHYLIKPVTAEKVNELLGRLFTQIEKPPRSLTLTDGREERRFPMKELQYLVSLDKGIELHLRSGREWILCPICQAVEQLADDPGFVQISRSCIVNLNAVLYLGSSNCHMKGGEELPISRRERRNVQSQWNDFIFRRMSQAEEAGL